MPNLTLICDYRQKYNEYRAKRNAEEAAKRKAEKEAAKKKEAQ